MCVTVGEMGTDQECNTQRALCEVQNDNEQLVSGGSALGH